MSTYAHWTPHTGTTELPALRLGRPLADQPTAELGGIPSAPKRHRTSAVARTAIHTSRVARRVTRSQAARDLKDASITVGTLATLLFCLVGGDWLNAVITGGVR